MYKLLISWRYLLTRYIALASIISMTLGVAAMIVVNAVMFGFTTEMEKRMHSMLSDVVFQVRSTEGIPDPEAHIKRIREIAGDQIAGMSSTVTTYGLLGFRIGEMNGTEHVQIIGIDCATQGSVCNLQDYLQHPSNRESINFLLRENGYDVVSPQSTRRPIVKPALENAGWEYRRTTFAKREKARQANDEFHKRLEESRKLEQTAKEQKEHFVQIQTQAQNQPNSTGDPLFEFGEMDFLNPAPGSEGESFSFDGSQWDSGEDFGSEYSLFDDPSLSERNTFDASREQHTGIILGINFALGERSEVFDEELGKWVIEDQLFLRPGDDVSLTIPTAGRNPKVAQDVFTVVDLFESRLAEHDQRLVFVPIEHLQRLRGMIDPQSGIPSATQIMIKAKEGVDIDELRDRIRAEFGDFYYMVQTWKDCQAPIIAAVHTEVAMLNVLLFLIFAVAGFGILAIFYMIVLEKSKDIGIMKSLGASSGGIMQIFLAYSFSLGIVGAGAGIGLGMVIVSYIKEIAEFLSWIRGHNVFDPAIYSFAEVQAVVLPGTVFWIVMGAILIAICSGVLPALRAARLKPVDTLRG